ncbi:DUF317 domain-containing protein [Streptomyces sp. NPDC058457]|uniref:DUF317 domain-containing protein n=1 Tax=Streptomyces sp. NPDC058457 TaxID=3346507 RepID=UPI00364B07AD
MAPPDIPRRGRWRPVRRLHRTAPGSEPGHLATWPVWAAPGPDRPTWAITASPHTPRWLPTDLSESLAHETGTRQAQPGREHKTRLAASTPAAPAVTAGRPVSRSR